MVNLDLVVAIQNALARNQGMDTAIESLINAGYLREDIMAAARQLQSSMQQQEQIPLAILPPATSPLKKAPPKNRKIILLIVFFSLLALGILAYVLIKLI